VPLPAPAPDTSLLRFRVLYQGYALPASPSASSDLTLSREPADNADAGAFYYRDKLSGGPLVFTGADYRLLWAIENSTARCEPLGLLVEYRGNPTLEWEQWQGSFTCSDCEFNKANCTVSLAPQSADPYQKLLDHYDKEYNILLDVPDKLGNLHSGRTTVTAELITLAAGVSIEFRPVSIDEEADYIGTDGWVLFLTNRSWIPATIYNASLLSDGLQNDIDIIFRYRLRNVPMIPATRADGATYYIPIDKSNTGWQVLREPDKNKTGLVDYVKAPGIAGFKTYKIGTYSNWNDPRNPAAVPLYGDQLLLIDASSTPADYGYDNSKYIELTGSGGFNSPPDECPSGLTVRIRRYVGDEQCSKLYWKFGSFRFGRSFRLVDGFYSLLAQTVLPYGGSSLLPPTAEQLSDFLTNATNPATGEAGEANELPRLLLSAGSDVKRYGASEAATRLLISLKQFLADLSALYDGGWFIDPATGWLRFEHRAYLESQRSGQVDLRELEDVVLPATYSYRTGQLPRYEELGIANGSTEDAPNDAYFGKASLDYGLGACVNSREGSNRVALSVSRLTGDVAAGVLNGDSIPDNALFVLAPDQDGTLSQANRQLSASQLLYRYYRRGRAFGVATIEGPAPQTAPNTVTGTLPVTGFPAVIESVRPSRVQQGISGRLCALATLAPTTSYTTNLGEDGTLAKAALNLRTRQVTLSVWLPPLFDLTAPPEVGRQFSDSFSDSFN
jgi:hypothetical protein